MRRRRRARPQARLSSARRRGTAPRGASAPPRCRRWRAGGRAPGTACRSKGGTSCCTDGQRAQQHRGGEPRPHLASATASLHPSPVHCPALTSSPAAARAGPSTRAAAAAGPPLLPLLLLQPRARGSPRPQPLLPLPLPRRRCKAAGDRTRLEPAGRGRGSNGLSGAATCAAQPTAPQTPVGFHRSQVELTAPMLGRPAALAPTCASPRKHASSCVHSTCCPSASTNEGRRSAAGPEGGGKGEGLGSAGRTPPRVQGRASTPHRAQHRSKLAPSGLGSPAALSMAWHQLRRAAKQAALRRPGPAAHPGLARTAPPAAAARPGSRLQGRLGGHSGMGWG